MFAWKTWPGTLTEERGVVSPVRCSQTPPTGGYQNPDLPYPFTQCGRWSAGRPLLHHQGVAMWALWGLVQAREDVLANIAEPEFDYIGCARCRMAQFEMEANFEIADVEPHDGVHEGE
jgi:hypothetical protein